MTGGLGNDFYLVDSTSDQVFEAGGGGLDIVQTTVSFTLAAEVETLIGSGTGAIDLTGNIGNNSIFGTGAANRIDGGLGADQMAGGTGNDTYVVDNAGDRVDEAGNAGFDTVLASASVTLANTSEIELLQAATLASTVAMALGGSDSNNRIVGNNGANTLLGLAGNDVLSGEGGNDRVEGGVGNDTMGGGAGKDTMIGGAGRDVFSFITKPNKKANLDKITDFNVRDDAIHLDNAVFTKLGKKGTELKPVKANKQFFSINSAKDKNDHIIYNKKTGVVFYDEDGNGSKKAVEIAVLKKGLKMTADELLRDLVSRQPAASINEEAAETHNADAFRRMRNRLESDASPVMVLRHFQGGSVVSPVRTERPGVSSQAWLLRHGGVAANREKVTRRPTRRSLRRQG